MNRLKIGIVGAGNISGIYIGNLLGVFQDEVELRAIADDFAPEKAQAAAEKHGIDFVKTGEALMARPDIAIVLNLTPPAAHFEVAFAALEAGKHVYNEKPLCAKLEDGATLLEKARQKNLRVGGSPDTFLGAGLLSARKLLDAGWVGRPVAGTAFLANHGPEHWHPNPAFFYAEGGGPLFDMGPYYLTALVSLLGPVAAVTGNTAAGYPERVITSVEQYGKTVKVTTPTHISAILDFKSGAVITLIMSFDVWAHSLPCIELYGTEGTMRIGDPNFFTSPVEIKRHRAEAWSSMALLYPGDERRLARLSGSDNWRGIGITDMALAIGENRPHRASGTLAYHVLEVMTSIMESGKTGKRQEIKSACPRPEAL